MQDKIAIINEIKELYKKNSIKSIEIAPEVLEYLELKDLKNLKAKVLESLTTLTQEDRKWLKQFKKN